MNRLISLLFLVLLIFLVTQVSAEHYVMSNQSFSVDEMTDYDIKAIYLGRIKQMKNGEVLSPCYLLPEKSLMDEFFIEVVKKKYSRFVRYWNKRMFAGGGTPPIEVKDEAGLIEYLLNIDGAICISANRINMLPDAVKIISVLH